jgi:hypothetical protein
MSDIPTWQIAMDYIEACNCDFGCPCNFNGYPSNGKCETMAGYFVRDGHYGNTDLTGIKIVLASVWPGAIHQGNGHVRLHMSKDSTDAQRTAVMQIFSGRAGGNGPFALFAATFSTFEKPVFTDIDMHIDGRKSWFHIPGLANCELEPFTNPVSGDEQDIQVHLPQGFIFKTALAAKTRVMKLLGLGPLSFDHSGHNGFFARLDFAGP